VRLRDATKAEDMVQETFLAALKGQQSFAGRSAEKSWLVGILKHKILDYYRKASRETAFTDLDFYSDEESDRFIPDGMFKGGWAHELGVAWKRTGLGSKDEILRGTQNALGGVGLEPHAQLRGDVALGIALARLAGLAESPTEDAAALSHLRLVRALLQAFEVPAPRGAAIAGASRDRF
jgi:hypothetical protein